MPDPTPFLKFGFAGLVLFGGILALVIAYKVITGQLTRKNGNVSGNGERTSERFALQQAQKQLDEIKAGSQPVEFWVKKYDESAERAAEPIMEALERIEERQEVIEAKLEAVLKQLPK